MVVQYESGESGDRKRRGFRRYRGYLAPSEVIDFTRTHCILEKQLVDLHRFIDPIHRKTQKQSFSSTRLGSEYHGTYRHSR